MFVTRACAAVALLALLVGAQVHSFVTRQECARAVTGSVDTSKPYVFVRNLSYELGPGETDFNLKLDSSVCTRVIGTELWGLKLKFCDYVLPTITPSPDPLGYDTVHVHRNGDTRGVAKLEVVAVCGPSVPHK